MFDNIVLSKRQDNRRRNLIRASDVKPKKLVGVWNNRFCSGKLGFIAGEPGLGKSLVAILMASTVSTGGKWPGAGTDIARRGDVIYITAKDNAADTIRPRLEAGGADLGRVHLVERVGVLKPRTFRVVDDLERLDKWLQAISEPRLVIIDPINACLSETDGRPFNSKSVSQGLVPSLLRGLKAIATKHRVAIVCVTHTKIGGALYPITDSFAYVAAAPSVFMVLRVNANPGKRVFTPDRHNFRDDGDVLDFRIEQRIVSDNISAPYAAFT